MKRSDNGAKRHCNLELIPKLSLWLLYCTNVDQKMDLLKVISILGLTNQIAALGYGFGKSSWS